jgi:hypothetical protein
LVSDAGTGKTWIVPTIRVTSLIQNAEPSKITALVHRLILSESHSCSMRLSGILDNSMTSLSGLLMARSPSSSVLVIRKSYVCKGSIFVNVLRRTGYGQHGDYVFGWKGDALQKAMDANCGGRYGGYCPVLTNQTWEVANACTQRQKVLENIDGCK